MPLMNYVKKGYQEGGINQPQFDWSEFQDESSPYYMSGDFQGFGEGIGRGITPFDLKKMVDKRDQPPMLHQILMRHAKAKGFDLPEGFQEGGIDVNFGTAAPVFGTAAPVSTGVDYPQSLMDMLIAQSDEVVHNQQRITAIKTLGEKFVEMIPSQHQDPARAREQMRGTKNIIDFFTPSTAGELALDIALPFAGKIKKVAKLGQALKKSEKTYSQLGDRLREMHRGLESEYRHSRFDDILSKNKDYLKKYASEKREVFGTLDVDEQVFVSKIEDKIELWDEWEHGKLARDAIKMRGELKGAEKARMSATPGEQLKLFEEKSVNPWGQRPVGFGLYGPSEGARTGIPPRGAIAQEASKSWAEINARYKKATGKDLPSSKPFKSVGADALDPKTGSLLKRAQATEALKKMPMSERWVYMSKENRYLDKGTGQIFTWDELSDPVKGHFNSTAF